MTEEEALTKWCPFARVGVDLDPGYGVHPAVAINRSKHGDGEGRALCLGSACMAWRWKMVQTNADALHSMMATYPPVRPIYEPTDSGGCGLAGSPQ